MKKILIIIIISLAILVGFIAIAPTPMDYDSEEYNVKEALINLQSISKTQHSVTDYIGHEEVRQFLINKSIEYAGKEHVYERNYLTKSNSNPTVDLNGNPISYIDTNILIEKDIDEEYDIRNILVNIPGESNTGILLVAHYDSRGNIKRAGELAQSYGAGDDGYGVSTLLEIMRYFASNKINLKNSIYFLFADAEETGRYGSIIEAQNEELMNKVNFVINVEGRGMNGAAYMFETSKNNNKVIELYKKGFDKVSYSVAPAVYSVMTNFTDFMSFTEVGKQGLNFSTLNDINDYHVPSDNYENVNPSSLQHYGSQIIPIVKEYVSDLKYSQKDYFKGTHDMVFFNFLPDIFVIYSSTTSIIISCLIMILIIALLIILLKRRTININILLKQTGFLLIGIIASIIFGFTLSLIIARLEGYPWSLVNVRSKSTNIIMILFIIGLFTLFSYLFKKYNDKKGNSDCFLLSSVIINSILSLLSSVTLSGASFMFMIPGLVGILYFYLNTFIKDSFKNKKLILLIMIFLSLFIVTCIFVPLITSLLYAITIGGAAFLAMLSFLPYSTLLPIIRKEINI